jgi:hypothetical protein
MSGWLIFGIVAVVVVALAVLTGVSVGSDVNRYLRMRRM